MGWTGNTPWHMLCLKWCDKCPVCVLSTKHNTVAYEVKTNYLGQPDIKLVVIQESNLKIWKSVDHSDDFLANYETLKSIKLYRKLLLHLINMVILNLYILNKKYGDTQMSHTSYRKYIGNYLISTCVQTAKFLRKNTPQIVENSQLHLTGRHFICKIKSLDDLTQPPCKLPLKCSSFRCSQCTNATLCVTPCFEIYHTECMNITYSWKKMKKIMDIDVLIFQNFMQLLFLSAIWCTVYIVNFFFNYP